MQLKGTDGPTAQLTKSGAFGDVNAYQPILSALDGDHYVVSDDFSSCMTLKIRR